MNGWALFGLAAVRRGGPLGNQHNTSTVQPPPQSSHTLPSTTDPWERFARPLFPHSAKRIVIRFYNIIRDISWAGGGDYLKDSYSSVAANKYCF